MALVLFFKHFRFNIVLLQELLLMKYFVILGFADDEQRGARFGIRGLPVQRARSFALPEDDKETTNTYT